MPKMPVGMKLQGKGHYDG